MKLEYAGVSKENLKSGISLTTTNSVRSRNIKNIYSKKSSNMLDWLDLPNMPESDIVRLETYGNYIRKKFKNLIVFGIGGSALGIKMLKNTFVDSIHKCADTNVEVVDNIDSDYFLSLLNSIKLKKTMFNVITKSGSTSETLAQMMIAIERMKKAKIDYTKHVCVTTTKDNALYTWAVSQGIEVIEIPVGVGGRYSVLSPVGLLPAVVMGIDIRALLKGAMKNKINSEISDVNNLAYTSAHINYTYLSQGLTNLVVMPYSDRLALVPDFFAQLWAESLGKKYNRNGEIVYAGQTPIKTLGVTDQHSQLQLYSEGIKDKLIMFITVEKPELDEKITLDLDFAMHLKNTTIKTLLDYECNSTAYSLTTLDRPNYTIALKCINEENIGELIFFMEMMTAFMGEMMNVDAYDQPGVELSKIYTKACLKVKGYEEAGMSIKKYSSDKRNFSL